MKYKLYNKVIIRTPLAPIKTSFTINELWELYTRKDIKESLFIASPALHDALEGITNLEEFKKKDKLVISLLKYALRFHIRCTPFGLFAGVGVSEWGDQYLITESKSTRHTRLDMLLAYELSQNIAKLTPIAETLKFFPNSSVYTLHNNIRYVEFFLKNNKRIHNICQVEGTEYITVILENAKSGKTIAELSQLLVDEDIDILAGKDFINELIEAQLIVSELDISVVGEEPLHHVVKVLKSVNSKSKTHHLIIQKLSEIENLLSRIDENFANNLSLYNQIINLIEELNIPFERKTLFQCDLYKEINPSTNQPENIINDKLIILNVINCLNKLTEKKDVTNLSNFQEKFFSRYEHQEMPLLEVLDNESGIGYASTLNNPHDDSSLIEGLRSLKNSSDDFWIRWTPLQSFLLKKMMYSIEHNRCPVIIEDEELKEFEDDWDDVPDTTSVIFQKINAETIFIKSVIFPSGINLIGRFTQANDQIRAVVNDIANLEKQHHPNAIIAQIAHLPESRTGNVLSRSSIRDFEIPYLSGSQISTDKQIQANDLYISIKKGKIVLRSHRLNKEIIPKIDNAHNYHNKSLPVYNFLCDLQSQHTKSGFTFSWGKIIENEFKFFPRVYIGKVIVSLATWILSKNEYAEILNYFGINDLSCILDWKEKHKLPNIICLADKDNELLVSLDNHLSIKMFISLIKDRPYIVIKETLGETPQYVSNEKGDNYNSEIIATLLKDVHYNNTIVRVGKAPIEVVRNFFIGSEWLYYKIYCGVKNSDELLLNYINPFTVSLIADNLIDHWFFIRYGDPDNHIRLRLHIRDLNKIPDIQKKFNDCVENLLSNGLVWKLQIDTYVREIERYGNNTMALSEQFFYYDSVCCLSFLKQIDDTVDERWEPAITYINYLLNKFELGLEDKLALFDRLKGSYSKEFGVNKYTKIYIDKRYRAYRDKVVRALTNEYVNYELSEVQELKMNTVISEIKDKSSQSDTTLQNLLCSYIHMTLNRVFINNQRIHELVLYDFLSRYYKSEIARKIPKLKAY